MHQQNAVNACCEHALEHTTGTYCILYLDDLCDTILIKFRVKKCKRLEKRDLV